MKNVRLSNKMPFLGAIHGDNIYLEFNVTCALDGFRAFTPKDYPDKRAILPRALFEEKHLTQCFRFDLEKRVFVPREVKDMRESAKSYGADVVAYLLDDKYMLTGLCSYLKTKENIPDYYKHSWRNSLTRTSGN